MDCSFFKSLLSKLKRTPQLHPVFNPTITPHPDTKRVTQTPLLILILFGLLIGSCIGFTAYSKAQHLQAPGKSLFKVKQTESDTPDWFVKKQAEGIITPEETKVPEPITEPLTEPKGQVSGTMGSRTPEPMESVALTPAQEAELQQWQQHEQEKQAQEVQQRTTLQTALRSETTIFNHTTANAPPPSVESKPAKFLPSTEAENYLLHTRVQPLSPFEIKAGTVIPSVMMGGINSTLPGQLIAQVTQNVYDTASGNVLLIPQGTRIVGSYEHQIANGQKRVLVVWNRLIYPDASSVTLEGMSGVDASGYGGFSDKTDTHFWLTFRNALMLSTVSAAMQLSQPKATNGNSYSSNQVAAGALGQQMNQVGMHSIGKTQNQAPTLTVRPGYIFNVMVNKDVILPPWINQGGLS